MQPTHIQGGYEPELGHELFELHSSMDLPETTAIVEQPKWPEHVALDAEATLPGVAVACALLGAAARVYLSKRREKNTRPDLQLIKTADLAVIQDEDPYGERRISNAGTRLVLKNMFADVIVTDGAQELSVTVRGLKSEVEKLNMAKPKRGIIVRGQHGANPHAFEVDRALVQTILSRGVMTEDDLKEYGIEVLDPRKKMRVTVAVPKGTRLVFRSLDGTLEAQGDYGNLVIASGMMLNAQIGSVQSAVVDIGSSSKVTIDQINGPFNTAVGHGSEVIVNKGASSPVIADLKSRARLGFYAYATDLEMTCGHRTGVRVSRAFGVVNVRHTDSEANTLIDGGEATSLNLVAGYRGKNEFLGKASSAELKTGDYAHVALGEIEGPLKFEGGYKSSAAVHRGTIDPAEIKLDNYNNFAFAGDIQSGTVDIGYDAEVSALTCNYDRIQVKKDIKSRFVKYKNRN